MVKNPWELRWRFSVLPIHRGIWSVSHGICWDVPPGDLSGASQQALHGFLNDVQSWADKNATGQRFISEGGFFGVSGWLSWKGYYILQKGNLFFSMFHIFWYIVRLFHIVRLYDPLLYIYICNPETIAWNSGDLCGFPWPWSPHGRLLGVSLRFISHTVPLPCRTWPGNDCYSLSDIENGPVEIVDLVDLAIDKMVDFSSSLCKRLL